MSGFLFVVPPLTGHINPTVGVAAELLARGHRVAWVCADPGLVRRLAGDGAEVFACAGTVEGSRPPELRGPEALRFLWEWYLLPLAEAMAPGVATAVEAFRPDVVVADQQAFAGALVAERLGVPWATSATTSAEFTDPLAGLPRVREWVEERLSGLRSLIGDPAGTADPRFSPRLVLAFSTPELATPAAGPAVGLSAHAGADRAHAVTATGRPAAPDTDTGTATGDKPTGDTAEPPADTHTDPAHTDTAARRHTAPDTARRAAGNLSGPVRWVGPSIAARPDPAGFPWEWLDAGRATVLVTLGTANTDVGGRFLDLCHDALRERADRVQGVIVDPGGTLRAPGDDKDVLVVPSVPQLALLDRGVDAVVCHAGHNTVCEALWHGVPLVVAPIRDDQPVVAGQVVEAGAGVRVRFGRVAARKLGAALDTVLDEPDCRTAAHRIRTSFRAAGGAPAAAAHLDELARELS
ncbi:glycosyltransferase [Streptomyces griseus]|uniref:glycosyltransferase n=1 Tax=Streptomyces griseus TaxID=1911 RepID=UPI0005656658|nr:glycosyltransferase [Streptomyces griseus]